MLRTVPPGIKTRGQWIISRAVTGLLPGLRVNKKSPWRSRHGLIKLHPWLSCFTRSLARRYTAVFLQPAQFLRLAHLVAAAPR
jgi:hypothetical protein